MKKISLLVAIIILLKLCPTPQPMFSGEGSYTFYVGNSSSNAQMITINSSEARSVKKSLKNIRGESLSTVSKQVISDTVSKYEAEFVFEERLPGVVCKYYYSELIKDYKLIDGKKINLHIAESENLYTVGSPMIFGGF